MAVRERLRLEQVDELVLDLRARAEPVAGEDLHAEGHSRHEHEPDAQRVEVRTCPSARRRGRLRPYNDVHPDTSRFLARLCEPTLESSRCKLPRNCSPRTSSSPC